jgi:hypothetical protein
MGLVAARRRMRIDVPSLKERIEQHPRPDLLAFYGVPTAADLLSLYVGDEFFFRDRFHETVINRVDLPWVEFQAARRVVSDQVVALNNRERIYELHEDVVGIMSTSGLQPKERAQLAQELAVASDVAWELFHARTLRLHAAANRQIPEAQRKNDPEALEVSAFQALAGILQVQPDHSQALEMLIEQLKSQLTLGGYASVVQATSELMSAEGIGQHARLRNLRGMALLLASCDERQRGLFTDPLRHAISEFRSAVEEMPELVEASMNLAVALFLASEDRTALQLLREARERLEAAGIPASMALPPVAQGIYLLLTGYQQRAVELLLALPPELPYREAVLQRVREWTASGSGGAIPDG